MENYLFFLRITAISKNLQAKKLSDKYSNLITWHCLNHRWELSVGEAAVKVNVINYSESFMDKLYSLHHQSQKNQCELELRTENVLQKYKNRVKIWREVSCKLISAVCENYSFQGSH